MREKVDEDWIRTMVDNFGRRMTVETIMELYHFSMAKAQRAILKAMEVTQEQVDGAAEKIIAGGVLC